MTQQVSKGSALDGQLRVRSRSGAPLLVSGAVTAAAVADGPDEGLRDALATFTAARYGRGELAAGALDEGLAHGMAAASRLAAHHAWWRESLRRLRARARATRERVWAR